MIWTRILLVAIVQTIALGYMIVDRQAVLKLLDGRNVKDEYIRSLAVVALKHAAKQASAS